MARVLSALVLLPVVIGTVWFLPPIATLVLACVAPAVVGLNFRWLFNEQYGLIDAVLVKLGLPAIPWLSDPRWALVSGVIGVLGATGRQGGAVARKVASPRDMA